jgi:hypothetical protein
MTLVQKRALRALLVVTLAAQTTACATTYAMTPQSAPNQTVRYDHGNTLVASEKTLSAVRVSPAGDTFQKRLIVSVAVFNKGTTQTHLGYENVRITTGSGVPLTLVPYERLMKEAKTAAAWQTFAVALAAGADAYSAAQPTTASTSGSYYGSGGGGSYSSTTTVYNPAAAQAANQISQANTDRRLQSISAQLDDRLSRLGGDVLRTTTIDPGEANGGQVVAELPRFAKDEPPEIRVFVTVNGEVHEFRYTLGTVR